MTIQTPDSLAAATGGTGWRTTTLLVSLRQHSTSSGILVQGAWVLMAAAAA